MKLARPAASLGVRGSHRAAQPLGLHAPPHLDRGRRPFGEDHGRLLVFRGELAVRLLGEIQVAPRHTADDDRHTEEPAHGRVTLGEAVAARVFADVAQPQRLRLPDQDAEYASAARQIADRRARLLIDPERQELLERGPLLVEDSERRVACSGDLARRRQNPIEDSLWIEFGNKSAPRIEQTTQAQRVEGSTHHGSRSQNSSARHPRTFATARGNYRTGHSENRSLRNHRTAVSRLAKHLATYRERLAARSRGGTGCHPMRERRMGSGATISPTRWAISYPTPDAPLLRALV